MATSTSGEALRDGELAALTDAHDRQSLALRVAQLGELLAFHQRWGEKAAVHEMTLLRAQAQAALQTLGGAGAAAGSPQRLVEVLAARVWVLYEAAGRPAPRELAARLGRWSESDVRKMLLGQEPPPWWLLKAVVEALGGVVDVGWDRVWQEATGRDGESVLSAEAVERSVARVRPPDRR
jgi:hypothetical protein